MSERARKLRLEPKVAAFMSAWVLLVLVLAGVLIWALPLGTIARVAVAIALLGLQAALLIGLIRSIVAPLRTLTNVVEGYRRGDYTLRTRRQRAHEALGDLADEINRLGKVLYEQRLHAIESSALLDKLIGAVDSAILAFDGERRVRLLNPAASRLLAMAPERALGKDMAELSLAGLLSEDEHSHIVTSIAGNRGYWQVTHGTFRERGLTQHLLIITDVKQALREEERTAWQRIIRVISHEVNNSLAPIKSLAGTLQGMLTEALAAGPMQEDVQSALQVIGKRTDALQRFLARYSRLSRLSAPQRRWVRLAPLLARLAKLEQPHAVVIEVTEGLEAFVDEDQIEQALINLLKNAIEAHGDAQGGITVTARGHARDLIVLVTDEGLGVANPDNLFVPFFTTKPGGGGIGLLLCRQIAEAHGGTLRLENRTDRAGATATLEFPGAARATHEG